ncbi:MAG: transposase [Acidimicrobiales bacterium]
MPPQYAGPGQLGELVEFRAGFYRCLASWGDALFELGDATLSSPSGVGSVPQLSLEPVFRRSHGSLYKALDRGRIDEERLRALLVEHRPKTWPLIFAVDASTWARCDAECSPERGFYYSASKHSAGQPIVAGWSYQWISQLSRAHDSWTAPLDVMRIPPSADATNSTVAQVRRLVGLLPDDGDIPLFVFDAGYDPIALGHDLADVRAEVLTRIRDDRVFYADPPPRPNRPQGTGGRPPRHGRRFKCADRRTWSKPSASLVTSDLRYGTVTVQAWDDLHPRLARRGHLGRLGGDEFALFMPTDSEDPSALEALERIVRGAAAHDIALSVGVAAYDPADPADLDALLREADQDMYDGRRARNAVSV